MTPEKLFEMWPKQNECFVVGSEVFLTEKDATEYSKHFNLGNPSKVERPKQPEAKKEAAPKAAAPKAAAPKAAAPKAQVTKPAVTSEGEKS